MPVASRRYRPDRSWDQRAKFAIDASERKALARLSKSRFQRSSRVGTLVTILDDHGRGDGEAVLAGKLAADNPRPIDDDSSFRDLERTSAATTHDAIVHDVVDTNRCCKHDSGREHRAPSNDRSLVHSTVAADQYVVLDDHGAGPHWLENAADLRRSAHVYAAADLCARAHERMRIDHAAFVDVGADIDVHRRHADRA